MATWGDLKASAAQFLGLKITDYDVGNVPLLATDPYGNLILGAHGFAQLAVKFADGTQGLVEGNAAGTVGTTGIDAVTGKAYTANLTGNAFINDMAATASPFATSTGARLPADTDTVSGNAIPFNPATGDNTAYDNELLDKHYVAGDGRVNENIGLTAIQNIFHAEHDRLVVQLEQTVQTNLDNGDTSFAANWVLPGVDLTVINGVTAAGVPTHIIQPNEWNGERVFQAAKFGTETEYQHIVFDEFARMVAPTIHPAGATNVHLDPAITSEFANVVYRFGHSMLDENINLYVMDANGRPVIDPTTGQPMMTQEGLIQAFTNPTLFANGVGTVGTAGSVGTQFNGAMTADLILGTVNQVGNEIDQFVTGALQDNLLGLPLDLPALNIARGRDTGVAPLNLARAQLFADSGEAQLKPYTSWNDFGSQLKDPNSLINFVAAYGTHSSLTAVGETNAQKLAAAQNLINLGTVGLGFNPINPASLDAHDFLNSQGIYANNRNSPLAVHDATGAVSQWASGSVTGVDNIDMWIGGLAEKQSLFGGLLGSTFEYVFRTQLEALQDADRLYYLPRIEGMSYEESLQDSSLAQLIRANTDIKHLPGNIFTTPEYTIEASTYFNADGSVKDPGNANHTWLTNPVTGAVMLTATAGNTLTFFGDNNFTGNEIVLGGTEGNDVLTAGPSDADTVWGDGGNDVIDGGGGADFLFGGDGNDTILGGQGADTLHGDAGNDTIYGGDDLDTIFGGDGNDYIEGGRGDDSIFGGLGNDIEIGNEGFNTLIGNEGDDWLENRGGNGSVIFGDSGAPTGQQPLYSGNDVMVGGLAGGDIMKGFSGDDIMLGHGSFTKFIGGLGWDWGSYELATQGVDEDMNRKEFVAANGAVDNVRDVWQHTEGASGSAFNDIILGDNATRLLATKDELDNITLIQGLSGFFDPGVVSFDGGNIILGGAGSDTLIGGGGNDIIDGDAWLHVGLTSYSAGGQILRQILTDPNGNTYDPATAHFTLGANGLVVPGSFVQGGGHVNAGNVDTAIYHSNLADYNVALFGPDAEGFLTIQQNAANVIVGGNPQGLLGGNDDTDRIRNIERLQFADGTVAIDKNGNMISSSFNPIADPNYAVLYAPYYDAVPFGTPTLTDSSGADPTVTAVVGDILTGSVAGISDYDNIFAGINANGAPTNVAYQWQYLDALSGQWINYAGQTSTTLLVNNFLETQTLGARLGISYVDGKGYTEQLFSKPTAIVTLPVGAGNTAPFLTTQTQFNGIANTSAVLGSTTFDFFSPFTSIFNDLQTSPDLLTYTATLIDGTALSNAHLQFQTVPGILAPPGGVGAPLAGEFSVLSGINPDTGLPYALDTAGEIGVRVRATDPGGLSTTSTFFINVLPPNSPPNAIDDSYTTLENVGLTAIASTGVLHNDSDPNADPFTAAIVAGPTNGALTFHADGTFVYIPNKNFVGADSFTYQDTDSAGAVSNIATATISVVDVGKITVVPTAPATTNSVTETFTVGGLTPVAGTLALSWDTSADGVLWNPTGVASTTFLPGLTGPTGIFLRGTASFQNAGNTVSVTSDPVYYISDNDLGDNMTGTSGNNIIFGNGGDDLIAAGIGSLLAYGGAGNDTFVATVGDGVATFDGQAGVNTVDMSQITANATVNLVTGTATSAQTSAATLVSIQNVVDGLGNDTIIGDANNNVFFATVGDGNDVYTGGAGIDTYDLSRTAAGATVNLGLGTSSSADTGNDTLAGIENAVGSTGNDTFVAAVGDGNNSYAGGLGTDTYDLSATTATATVNLATGLASSADTGSDTLTGIENVIGGAGADTITGDANDNVLNGGAGNDTMVGGGGNDTFIGGTGADSMTGAAGNDTYYVDNVGDVVVELANQGTDTVVTTLNGSSAAPYTLGANVENLTFNGVGNFFGNGNGLANVITGGAGNDTLNGNAGADTMIGGLGNDSYVVDNAGDVVIELAGGSTGPTTPTGAGGDTVFASVSYDLTTAAEVNSQIEHLKATVDTGAEVNSQIEHLKATVDTGVTLTGNAFSHDIQGRNGSDTLIGGSGNDTLTGNLTPGAAGIDTMIGGAGNDTYNVDNGADVVTEAAGGGTNDIVNTSTNYSLATAAEVNSQIETLMVAAGTTAGLTLTGNAFSHIITGGVGNDTLIGGTGNDTMTGGAGNDNLQGGGGDNTLDGGVGVDTMAGGAGNDTYFVDNAGDVVTEAANGGTADQIFATASYSLATAAEANSQVESLKVSGTAGLTLTGNAFSHNIVGGVGSDTLIGGTGNDTLTGGGGTNTMSGGLGNDITYFVSSSTDVVNEVAGQGTDTVFTSVNYALTAGSEIEFLEGDRGHGAVAHRQRAGQHHLGPRRERHAGWRRRKRHADRQRPDWQQQRRQRRRLPVSGEQLWQRYHHGLYRPRRRRSQQGSNRSYCT